ncbi:MAG: glycerophosphodiester phosphodiesterase [Ktedonobacteraceae bacterium]
MLVLFASLITIVVIIAIIALVHMLLYVAFSRKVENPIFPELKKPLMLAHQGGELLAPSNTMAAFDLAHKIGDSDFFDIDVHMTKDGYLVGIHDATVDRTTNGHGRVDAHTLAELQALDAGYYFQDLQGEYSYRSKGVQIFKLEDLFYKYGHRYYLHIEIKDTYPKHGLSQIEVKLWALIQKYHITQRVIVASFYQRIVNRFHRLTAGQVVIGAGKAEITQFVLAHKLHLPGFYYRKSHVLEIPTTSSGFNLKDRKLIEGAHRLGMEVYYWTIDDKAEMRELLEMGADGLFTNRPDILKELREEMGLR